VFRENEVDRLTASVGDTVTGATGAFRALIDDGEWWRDLARADVLREPLLRLCAEYLTRPNKGVGGIDPVARFHLGNGARLERINWLGNTSARGMKEAFGVMVNYLYDPDAIEANHEVFVHSGTVARSAQVDGLLSLPALQPEPPPSKRRLPRIRSS
jgi:malonyl-CoA decarboxylase